jgi:hypothetical protein
MPVRLEFIVTGILPSVQSRLAGIAARKRASSRCISIFQTDFGIVPTASLDVVNGLDDV